MKANDPKESSSLTPSPYPVHYVNNGAEGYFTSDLQVRYLLAFTQNEGESNNPQYRDTCVTVSLVPQSGYKYTERYRGEFDPRVEPTVMGELVRLFKSNQFVVVYFSCDTSNEYERNRHITFGKWYTKYLLPLGVCRKRYSNPSQRVYACVYYFADHPYRTEIEEDFSRLLYGK